VIDGKPSPWVGILAQSQKSIASFAARLRLAPQMRARSRGAGRNHAPIPSIYEMMAAGRND